MQSNQKLRKKVWSERERRGTGGERERVIEWESVRDRKVTKKCSRKNESAWWNETRFNLKMVIL